MEKQHYCCVYLFHTFFILHSFYRSFLIICTFSSKFHCAYCLYSSESLYFPHILSSTFSFLLFSYFSSISIYSYNIFSSLIRKLSFYSFFFVLSYFPYNCFLISPYFHPFLSPKTSVFSSSSLPFSSSATFHYFTISSLLSNFIKPQSYFLLS